MAHTFNCNVCNRQFIVSDKLFAERIAGRRVTIPCKHCGAPFTMDGTCHGNVAASSQVQEATSTSQPSSGEIPAPAASGPIPWRASK